MDKKQSSRKISADNEEYDIFMGIYELGVTLGNYRPNVHQIFQVLAKSSKRNTSTNDSMEGVLLNDIRLRYEDLQEQSDAEGKFLHEAEQHIFMCLYKELVGIDTDERERMKYIELCCELFGEDRKKDMGFEESLSFRLKCIDRLHMNIEKITARLDAATDQESNVNVHSNEKFDLHADVADTVFGRTDDALDYAVNFNGNDPVEASFEVPVNLQKEMPVDFPSDILIDTRISLPIGVNVNAPIEESVGAHVSVAVSVPIDPVDHKTNGVQEIFREFQEKNEDLAWEHLKQTKVLASEFIQTMTIMGKVVPRTNTDQVQKCLQDTTEDLFSLSDDLEDISSGLSKIYILTKERNSLSRLTVLNDNTKVPTVPPRQKSETDFEELHDYAENTTIVRPYTVNMEQKASSEFTSNLQHQRHIIAAPRYILKLFKSNPSMDLNAPNLFEQLDQFYEETEHKDNVLSEEMSSILSRLKIYLRNIKKDLPKDITYSDWLTRVAKCQLTEILTSAERDAWQLRNRGGQELTDEDRYRDALDGLLGFESAHPRLSALNSRLPIRSPHHQHSISESYLLLALGHVGSLYRSLKLKVQELAQQGRTQSDQALAECIRGDLSSFHEFYNQQVNSRGSLLRLFLGTRGFQQRFQVLLNLIVNVQNSKSCVVSLYNQLAQTVDMAEAKVQNWLMIVSNHLLIKLNRWLRNGQLPESGCDEFFIVQNLALSTDRFWQERFQLAEAFSMFFDSRLSMLMISIGRHHMFSRIYLFSNIETFLSTTELHHRLLDVFQQFYQNRDQEPLFQLVSELHSDVCGKVMRCLYDYAPVPLDLFQNLHKYLLLRDMHFVRQLIELLEPVLEGEARFYDTKQLNFMMSNMLSIRVSDLYVGEANSEGSKCWSRFVLHWKLPIHWKALLGDSVKQYASVFPGLWKFHHAYYVLCERIMRQNWHFRKHILLDNNGLEHVQCHFDKLIDILFDLMDVLKSFLLHEVLDEAFAELKLALQKVRSIDEMLEANVIYLDAVKFGSFQTKTVKRSSVYLEKVFSLILDLEGRQQKFYRLFHIYMDYASDDSYVGSILPNRLHDFRLSCQKTCDSLNDLEEEIYAVISDFLLSLHIAGYPALKLLARRLDSQGLYENRKEVLCFVDTHAFWRTTKQFKT
ncbi:uncharacterized protein t-Grip91 [Drosophila pseudoobscura]|uniref:Uncharacterized protein t-Grip91 n=1 Tax=Drosophila pseudoobscura pseudoobscura TaxID=46245 RepID=A0A6I8UY90_DROPS|nr:uncharacterized protein LOC6902669 [Drosophila pseudoobscura]